MCRDFAAGWRVSSPADGLHAPPVPAEFARRCTWRLSLQERKAFSLVFLTLGENNMAIIDDAVCAGLFGENMNGCSGVARLSPQ